MSLPWSFIGAPAVTFPCSTYDNGLPAGVQVTSGQGLCRRRGGFAPTVHLLTSVSIIFLISNKSIWEHAFALLGP
jgi:hypothetical protein